MYTCSWLLNLSRLERCKQAARQGRGELQSSQEKKKSSSGHASLGRLGRMRGNKARSGSRGRPSPSFSPEVQLSNQVCACRRIHSPSTLSFSPFPGFFLLGEGAESCIAESCCIPEGSWGKGYDHFYFYFGARMGRCDVVLWEFDRAVVH